MKTPTRSLLFSNFLFFFLISWVNSTKTHDEYFINCLKSQTSISTPDFIYTPSNTSSYESILQSAIFNGRFMSESTPKPSVIITPTHESQIQAAIFCAKKHGMQIRTRSGGHDYEGLSYTSEIPFVIIDLRNLRSITIDVEEKTVWAQAGATIGELYYAVAQKSRTLFVVAGDGLTMGVGGHISGGGTSMLSRKFGIAADHVIDAKIFDVNGRILDRTSMGEDLFWAIRGGGGASFGIILAFKMKLQTVPEIVTVFNVSRSLEQNATQLVHRWQYIADKIDENLMIRAYITNVISDQTDKRTLQMTFPSLFFGGVDDLLKIMGEYFPELGLVKDDCIEMSMVETRLFFRGIPYNSSLDVLLSRTTSRVTFKAKSDYVTHPISEESLQGFCERLLEEDAGASQVILNPYGGKMSQISESELPFPHRAGNIYNLGYYAVWLEGEDSSQVERHMSWIRKVYDYLAPYVSKSPRRAYYNYKDLDLGENNIDGYISYRQASQWGKKYFDKNFDRLVQVKTKVDPTNFFRNEQSIPSLFVQVQ